MSPTFARTGFGEKALLALVAASLTMSTFTIEGPEMPYCAFAMVAIEPDEIESAKTPISAIERIILTPDGLLR